MKKITLIAALSSSLILQSSNGFGKCNTYCNYKRLSDSFTATLSSTHIDTIQIYSGDKIEIDYHVNGGQCTCLRQTLWYADGNIIQQNIMTLVINTGGLYTIESSCSHICTFRLMIINPNEPPQAIASVSANTVCINSSIHLNGTAVNGTSISWTTSGSGTFSNAAADSPTYYPSNADAGLHFITLRMSVHHPYFPDAAATVQIVVVDMFPYSYSVSGPTLVEPDSKEVVYSAAEYPGTGYSWLTVGGIIVNGQGSNQIKVNWGGKGEGLIMLTGYLFSGCLGERIYFQVKISNVVPVNIPYPFSQYPQYASFNNLRYAVRNFMGEIISEGISNGEAILRSKSVGHALSPGIYFVTYYFENSSDSLLTDKVLVTDNQ